MTELYRGGLGGIIWWWNETTKEPVTGTRGASRVMQRHRNRDGVGLWAREDAGDVSGEEQCSCVNVVECSDLQLEASGCRMMLPLRDGVKRWCILP